MAITRIKILLRVIYHNSECIGTTSISNLSYVILPSFCKLFWLLDLSICYLLKLLKLARLDSVYCWLQCLLVMLIFTDVIIENVYI